VPFLALFFSDDLDDFVQQKQDCGGVHYPLVRRASIKNIIESLGVPHTEIGAIRIDGEAVDFNFIPGETLKCHIHGIQTPFDVTVPSILRPRPLAKIRFLVDVNVGKLAPLLRMSGIDASYAPHTSDKEISIMAEEDGRIILSRDLGLLKRRRVEFGRYIRSVYPYDQLAEVFSFFGLAGQYRPFSRCLRCNRRLIPVQKGAIRSRLEPKTWKYYDRFNICPGCSRIYWQGSHLDEMKKRLRNLSVINRRGEI